MVGEPRARKLVTIGRHVRVTFPDLGFQHVDAKVDTGAFRTVLHCESCEEVDTPNGKQLRANFKLNGPEVKEYYFAEYFSKEFKSSFGEKERRFCITTTLKIGRKKIKSSVSLTDRSDMKFQVLIGRKTLLRRFLVDVGKKFA
jgi:hypothetical protein